MNNIIAIAKCTLRLSHLQLTKAAGIIICNLSDDLEL